MNLKSLSVAVCAVFVLLCCTSRAQPQNLTELIQELKYNMDRALNPCDDFYQFACGNFIKQNPVPKNFTGYYLNWPTLQAVVNDTVRLTKKAVEQTWPVINDIYLSCNRPQAETNRSADETYRKWTEYINSTSLSSSGEIWDLIARVPFQQFIDIGTGSVQGFRGPSVGPAIVFEEWDNEEQVAEFLAFVELAFANDSETVATEKAKTVLEVTRYISGFEDPFDNTVVTIANASRTTEIDWQMFFQIVGVDLKPTDRISLLSYEKFFHNLTKYVTGLPEQTLRNYLQFNVFYAVKFYRESLPCWLGENDCNGEGRLNYPGFPTLDRSDRCALLTSVLVPDLVQFVITEETDSQTISAAKFVANGIKANLNASLPSLKWLTSAQDLNIASKKVEDVITAFGVERSERYSSVDTQPQNIFDNIFSVSKFKSAEDIRNSYLIPNRTSFVLPEFSFNPIFKYRSNLIYVPSYLLNGELFSSDWPKLFQFAKLGGAVARQFIHSIDKNGQSIDTEGFLFSNTTTFAYLKYQSCVEDTYKNYTFANKTFNQQDFVEDVADIGGLKNSFGAYGAYIARYGKEFPDGAIIPGFSTDQVFFLISAQTLCNVQNDEYTMSQQYNFGLPNKIRVNGAVSQSTDFAKAFNCPTNSPMNPARKCNIF